MLKVQSYIELTKIFQLLSLTLVKVLLWCPIATVWVKAACKQEQPRSRTDYGLRYAAIPISSCKDVVVVTRHCSSF